MTLKNAGIFTAIATVFIGTAAMANPKADTNQDGVITRAEFMAASDAKFAAADLNSDGYISQDERQTTRQNHEAEKRADIFSRIDANGDGMISQDEFDAAGDMRKDKVRENKRDRRDVNQDGQVDEADREAFREKMEARREGRKEMREQREQSGQSDGRRGRRGSGMRDRMAGIDANGDDLISAQEYQAGAEKMFERLDADGDGQLTQGEGMRKRRKRGKRRGGR